MRSWMVLVLADKEAHGHLEPVRLVKPLTFAAPPASIDQHLSPLIPDGDQIQVGMDPMTQVECYCIWLSPSTVKSTMDSSSMALHVQLLKSHKSSLASKDAAPWAWHSIPIPSLA